MQRSILVALGTLLVIALGALSWRGGRSSMSHPAESSAGSETGTTTSSVSGAAGAAGPAGSAASIASVVPPRPADAGVGLLGSSVGLAEEDAGASGADGGFAAFLPTGTPKTVRFGVVVVRYRGAEGQPVVERSKSDAQILARALGEVAKNDFRGAVNRGDPGSTEDAGRMPRGVLEPTVEYALFTLKPGEVTDPIDTARGFWILRRAD